MWLRAAFGRFGMGAPKDARRDYDKLPAAD